MRLETFSSRFEKVQFDFEGYGDPAVHDLWLATEAIRLQADEFSYWQRRRAVSRSSCKQRGVLAMV